VTLNPFLVGVPAMLAFLAIAYVAQEVALKQLDALQIGTLSLSLRQRRIKYVVSMVCVLVAFVLFRFSLPSLMTPLFVVFLAAAAMVTIGSEWLAWRVVRALEMPASFRKWYSAWRFFTVAGVLSLLGAMALTPLYDGSPG
jgi:hypothetical protein